MKRIQNLLLLTIGIAAIIACDGASEVSPAGQTESNSNADIVCTTAEATDIDPTSARLSGSVKISEAIEANGAAYFYYSADVSNANGLLNSVTRITAGEVSNSENEFGVTVSGLNPETKYYYMASVSIDGKDYHGTVKSFDTAAKPKDLIATGSATDITELSAVLTGYANPTPELGIVAIGVLISTNENPTLDNSTELTSKELDGNSMYSIPVSGLASNTTFYYKSFIQYGGVYRYGAVKSFKTLEIRPALITEPVTDVGMYTCTINGSLKVESVVELRKEVWFYFGNSSKLDELKVSKNKVKATLSDDGSFRVEKSKLEYDSEYSYVACAKVYDTEFYGDVVSFTTDDVKAVVTTGAAKDIGLFTATVSGSLRVDNPEELGKSVWFLYGTEDSIDALISEGKRVSCTLDAEGRFSADLSKLNHNTQYYLVACAKVHDKDFYGNVSSFTTDNIRATVTTRAAANIGTFTATVSASLVVDNPEEINKSVWFRYGTDGDIDALMSKGAKASCTLDSDGNFSADLRDLKYNTPYYFVACANVYGMEVHGAVAQFTTIFEAVDLGLSVKWAKVNIGASYPEDFGDYYAWGETTTKTIYKAYTYKWCNYYNSSTKSLTKYSTSSEYGTVDNKTVLDAEDDVAHVQLGGNWRMPTDEELTELREKCTWSLTVSRGVRGLRFTRNGNSIFLPAAGYIDSNGLSWAGTFCFYWSSSLYTDREYPWYAYTIGSDTDMVNRGSSLRYYGLSVRAVTD